MCTANASDLMSLPSSTPGVLGKKGIHFVCRPKFQLDLIQTGAALGPVPAELAEEVFVLSSIVE